MREFPPGHEDLRRWIAVDPEKRRGALREALGVSPSMISQVLCDPPKMTPAETHWQAIEVLTSGAVPRDRWRLPDAVERERDAIARAAVLRTKLAPSDPPSVPEAPCSP